MTNNDIREFLELPVTYREINIFQVDCLDVNNKHTLMFVSNPDVDLDSLDKSSDNVYLLNAECYNDYQSEDNDFILIDNPKFKFCRIVEYFKLHSRFQWHDSNHIGLRCKFDKGTIIGGEDFSPVLTDEGTLTQFPQMGGIYIGDDVVIKYNTMIGKGTFGYTTIKNNTMIDFGCQIGHNCTIGKSCIIAAGTIIGGSTTVGDHTVIGIGAKIRNGIKIGSNVSIGMGSVVINDIPDNAVIVGNPARIIEHKKIFDEKGLV